MNRLVLVLITLIVLAHSSMVNNADVPVVTLRSQAAEIPGETRAYVNLRSGPGTFYDVVAVLTAGTRVIFDGRNQNSTWLHTRANGMQGWLSYTFVNVEGNVQTLPVVGSTPSASAPPPPPPAGDVPQVAGPPGVVPEIGDTVRAIFLRGQELGNRPDVFAKVGDSITATDLFLAPIGLGGLRLYDYTYLQPVVDYFSQTPARDHFSFANTSLAARGGWTSADALDPNRAVPGFCRPGEMPLVCEYRNNRPAIALIMFGTNDLNWMDSATYQLNMATIVQISIDMGVIPVLSTIPDQPLSSLGGRVGEFNGILEQIAAAYGVPLWNYWLALQDLPNRGLGGDSVHPSYDPRTRETAIFSPQGLQYGFNIRNLTALMVLDAIWRGAMY